MNIEIIKANTKYSTQVVRLLENILSLHASGRPDLFKSEGGKYGEKELEEMFNNDSTPVFLAVDGDKLLGYIMCRIEIRGGGARRSYKCLYIDDLCVEENARCGGIGKMLTERAKKHAIDSGCYNVELNVWAFNENAIRFYEKNGFAVQRQIMEIVLGDAK